MQLCSSIFRSIVLVFYPCFKIFFFHRPPMQNPVRIFCSPRKEQKCVLFIHRVLDQWYLYRRKSFGFVNNSWHMSHKCGFKSMVSMGEIDLLNGCAWDANFLGFFQNFEKFSQVLINFSK